MNYFILLFSILSISFTKYKQNKYIKKKFIYIIKEIIGIYIVILLMENLLNYKLGVKLDQLIAFFTIVPEILARTILPKILDNPSL